MDIVYIMLETIDKRISEPENRSEGIAKNAVEKLYHGLTI